MFRIYKRNSKSRGWMVDIRMARKEREIVLKIEKVNANIKTEHWH